MHRLRRRSRILASLVLAWFTLMLGVGVAAPVVNPAYTGWICSSSFSPPAGGSAAGQELPDQGLASDHSLLCPLCASISAPPPPAPVVLGLIDHSPPALPAPLALPPVADPAVPPAARGPPAPASF